MRAVALLGITACLTGGCYNYDPLVPAQPMAGRYVAVTLTSAGSQELAPYLGWGVFVVRGRSLGDSDRGLLLSVSSVELMGGEETSWAGETVALPGGTIASIDVRRFSVGRSALLVGVGVTGLVASTAAFSLLGSGTRPGDPKGPPVKQ